MAIEDQTSSHSFVGNGSTVTAYAIPFRFDDPSWLVVTRIDADDVATVLTEGADYTVDGSNLVTTEAIPDTETLLVERNTPIEQDLATASPAGSYTTALEAQLDQLTMAVIDLQRRFGNTPLKLAIGTVTHLPEGQTPTASVTGSWPTFTLNLGLPTGATGGLDIGADASFGTTPNNEGGPCLTLWDQGTNTFRAVVLMNGEVVAVTFP